MQAFICTKKPRSVQARKKASYYEAIKDAYREFNASSEGLATLYGVVYYFHNQKTELDADNLSKPIWDALEGIVYADDKVVKLRHAGVIDLRKHEFNSFDLSRVPDEIFTKFIEVIGTEDHVIYVELGELDSDMYKFGNQL